MGHAATQAWHGVTHTITNVGHDIGGAIRKIPVIGKPIAKFEHYTAAALTAPLEFVDPSLGASVAGFHGAAAQRYHRLTNIGAAVSGTVLTAGALGAFSGAGAGVAGAAGAPLGFAGQADAAAMAAGGGTFTDVGAGGVLSSTAVGSGGFLSDAAAGLSNFGSSIGSGLMSGARYIGTGLSVAKNFLGGSGSPSFSGIGSALSGGYNYLSNHGGLFGVAGNYLGKGASSIGGALSGGAQDIGNALVGQKTTSGISLNSLRNYLSSEFSRFSNSQALGNISSSLTSSLNSLQSGQASVAAAQGAQLGQAEAMAAQAAGAAQANAANQPQQASMFGGSPIEIFLIIGVALGMIWLIYKGKL